MGMRLFVSVLSQPLKRLGLVLVILCVYTRPPGTWPPPSQGMRNRAASKKGGGVIKDANCTLSPVKLSQFNRQAVEVQCI